MYVEPWTIPSRFTKEFAYDTGPKLEDGWIGLSKRQDSGRIDGAVYGEDLVKD